MMKKGIKFLCITAAFLTGGTAFQGCGMNKTEHSQIVEAAEGSAETENSQNQAEEAEEIEETTALDTDNSTDNKSDKSSLKENTKKEDKKNQDKINDAAKQKIVEVFGKRGPNICITEFTETRDPNDPAVFSDKLTAFLNSNFGSYDLGSSGLATKMSGQSSNFKGISGLYYSKTFVYAGDDKMGTHEILKINSNASDEVKAMFTHLRAELEGKATAKYGKPAVSGEKISWSAGYNGNLENDGFDYKADASSIEIMTGPQTWKLHIN